MRRFLLTCLGLFAAALGLMAEESRPPTAEEFALFKDAMKNSSQDTEHWAYTETRTVRTSEEKVDPNEETVVRFDPSKPYAEQYTPLKIGGKDPSARQLRKYRKQGEERGKALALKAGQPNGAENREPQMVINDSKATLDLEHPRVLSTAADQVTYEILLVAKSGGMPFEKFQIFADVDRGTRQIQHARFHIRGAFRMKLIAKIKSGDATLDFKVVDPAFPPVVTTMKGEFGASFLLIPVKAVFTNMRTDWQRVTAFDERFNVKLAPLQFPGF